MFTFQQKFKISSLICIKQSLRFRALSKLRHLLLQCTFEKCTQNCVYPTDYLTIRCREREIKQGGEFHSKQRKHFLITSWSTPSDIKKKSTNTEDSTFDSGHRKKGTNQQCHKNGIIIFATETKKWGEGGGNQSLSIYTQKIGNDSPSQHDVQYTSHCTLSGPTFYNNSTKLPFTKRDSLRERETATVSLISHST